MRNKIKLYKSINKFRPLCHSNSFIDFYKKNILLFFSIIPNGPKKIQLILIYLLTLVILLSNLHTQLLMQTPHFLCHLSNYFIIVKFVFKLNPCRYKLWFIIYDILIHLLKIYYLIELYVQKQCSQLPKMASNGGVVAVRFWRRRLSLIRTYE
jgi:hypothetical protein